MSGRLGGSSLGAGEEAIAARILSCEVVAIARGVASGVGKVDCGSLLLE